MKETIKDIPLGELHPLHGMTPTKVTFEDIALVDELQSAQMPEAPMTEATDSMDA